MVDAIGLDQGLGWIRTSQTIEDSDGFIWVTSRAGVLKYDGYEFERFESFSDTFPLIKATTSLLIEAQKGRFWIGSSNHLIFYDKATHSLSLDNFGALKKAI